MNELAEHLNISFPKIQTTHSEAMNVIDIWRRRQINRIEDNYVEKIILLNLKINYHNDL
jgi:hypothetical protein